MRNFVQFICIANINGSAGTYAHDNLSVEQNQYTQNYHLCCNIKPSLYTLKLHYTCFTCLEIYSQYLVPCTVYILCLRLLVLKLVFWVSDEILVPIKIYLDKHREMFKMRNSCWTLLLSSILNIVQKKSTFLNILFV